MMIKNVGKRFACCLVMIAWGTLHAQEETTPTVKLPKVRDELAVRFKTDQDARFKLIQAMNQGQVKKTDGKFVINGGLNQKVEAIDKENTAWMKKLVQEHGWLGKTLVGKKAAHQAWLLVQHADKDPAFQKSCLALMEKMPKGEVAGADVAYLTDRVLAAENKPQRYGTQCQMKDGKAFVRDVEDRPNLNKRRAEVGLEPIEDYLKSVEEMYREKAKPNESKQEADETPYWTEKRRDAYSKRNVDPSQWDREMFNEDVESIAEHSWPTKAAISNFPSPVGIYDSPGGRLLSRKLKIGDKTINGTYVAWGKGAFNKHVFENKDDTELLYFNIFILTDLPKPEDNKKEIISRNHPHYLATGKQKTSLGEVDWVQLALADDNNYAIVAQRVFDLKYGKTLLVAPQTDGSLRFMQLQAPQTYNHAIVPKVFDDHVKELESNPKVIEFFSNEKTIK